MKMSRCWMWGVYVMLSQRSQYSQSSGISIEDSRIHMSTWLIAKVCESGSASEIWAVCAADVHTLSTLHGWMEQHGQRSASMLSMRPFLPLFSSFLATCNLGVNKVWKWPTARSTIKVISKKKALAWLTLDTEPEPDPELDDQDGGGTLWERVGVH